MSLLDRLLGLVMTRVAKYIDNLELVQLLDGTLEVELSEPTQPMEALPGIPVAPSGATIVGVKLHLKVMEDEEDDSEGRPLTPAELQSVVFRREKIVLRGLVEQPIEHNAPNGVHFTLQDVIRAIERTELESRGTSEWQGGVDVHHVFFEGLEPVDDGEWQIWWGS